MSRLPSRRDAVWVALAAAVASASIAGAQTQTADAPFDVDERRRMERGELVVRPEVRVIRGQRHVGGAAWVVIDATPDAVWRAALDYPRWVRFMPRLVEVHVARRGARASLRLRHELGPVSARYALDLRVDDAQRDLEFALDRAQPHDIDAAYGFFRILPHGTRRTLVVFGGMVDVGDGLVRLLFEERIHHWSLRVPDELKRWVESPEGRRRYQTPTVARP
ncbi:MAG: SRPBCC family protein [Deltaproteobacteria bacterium]|nr:SRPBCC family protein [Deltaproteobacteria bacterium]